MDDEAPPRVLAFPHARVAGKGRRNPPRMLGTTRLADLISPDGRGTCGHWCSRCQGVWFGQAGEVECPQCGNRHG